MNLTRLKGLQCHNCNMRIFWSFARDSWLHSMDQAWHCKVGQPEVAHPRVR